MIGFETQTSGPTTTIGIITSIWPHVNLLENIDLISRAREKERERDYWPSISKSTTSTFVPLTTKRLNTPSATLCLSNKGSHPFPFPSQIISQSLKCPCAVLDSNCNLVEFGELSGRIAKRLEPIAASLPRFPITVGVIDKLRRGVRVQLFVVLRQ